MIDIEAENRIEENTRLIREKGPKVRGRREDGWKFPPIKIVAGNKCDLKDARVVSSKVGWEWAKSKGCGFMETSAREMVNIEETFACMNHLRFIQLFTHADLLDSDCPPSRRSKKTTRPSGIITSTDSLYFQRSHSHREWCGCLNLPDAHLYASQATINRWWSFTYGREVRL